MSTRFPVYRKQKNRCASAAVIARCPAPHRPSPLTSCRMKRSSFRQVPDPSHRKSSACTSEAPVSAAFHPGPVDKETIRRILDVARYAASGGNGQPVQWLVVHDPAEVHALAGLTIDWMNTLRNSNHPLSGYGSFNHQSVGTWP